MNQPTDLMLQDVRCFKGEQLGRLRPITLLVGENSSGKTTFLACYAALRRTFQPTIDDPVGAPDFNRQPFVMGSFREIVRSRFGPKGRIDEFKLGFAVSGQPYARVAASFRENVSQPTVSCLRYCLHDGSFLEMRRGHDDKTIFEAPTLGVQPTDVPYHSAQNLLAGLAGWVPEPFRLDGYDGMARVVKHFPGLQRGDFGLPPFPVLIPVAPLRSKPKRTYDPVRETASAEGEHVPMLMMRLDRTDKNYWNALHDDLVTFGRDAGLFSDIKVKRHGKQISDPFQLQVKVRSGPHANIVDVGYGVSQSLPILVDIMAGSGTTRRRQRPARRTFLLQQPEVHLHPRGQAELASLFVKAYIKRGNHFLIETHSDYIVDRVRISVQQGLLPSEDVSILYFEPTGNAVKIHNMHLDRNGNLLGAPAGYREFFLKETDRLLGFAD